MSGESSLLSAQDREHILRTVERTSCLEAGVMSPTAGVRRVRLCTLREVEAFLLPISDEADAGNSRREKIYYVDPKMLVGWVRDVIGDAWLADGLSEIAATGQPYGVIVPALKQLLVDRLAQLDESQEHETIDMHE